ncbi:MAG: exodeoxyribonuclease VII large subunit [Gaiellales bacterium]
MSSQEAAERRVYTVTEFNGRLRGYLRRVRGVWVEGEIGELRRNDAWATVFLTLRDDAGASLPVQLRRARFDRLGLGLREGDRVQVQGSLDLWEARGQLVFRATAVERAGLGDQLAALERLKRTLAAEGLFAADRKRPLPRFPRAIGLVTGADAAARSDVEAALAARFPAARLVVFETRVQGPRAPQAIVAALQTLTASGRVDVIIVARGGGSFEDLLPFSDERVVRAFAGCSVPIVSAVGHEQDAPLCDLAADLRAATPTAAVRLVVPDATELRAGLVELHRRLDTGLRSRVIRDRELVGRQRERIGVALRRTLDRDRLAVVRAGERLRVAPLLLLERRRAALDSLGVGLQALSPQATLARGYAVVRHEGRAIREAAAVVEGDRVEIELAVGALAARIEG